MGYSEYKKQIEKNHGYSHSSRARGYVSRVGNCYSSEIYEGKFGKGLKVFRPAFDSTQYCFVEYWIDN